MNLNKFFLTFIIAIIFIIIAIVVDFKFIENIIIPDICAYHSGKPISKIFELFYCFPPDEGGYPFPTAFHFIFIISVGTVLGYIVSRKVLKNLK